MKKLTIYGLAILIALLTSCQKDEVFPENKYYNTLSFPDSSANHPKNDQYNSVLDAALNAGVLGASLMIRDEYGTWLGAGGYADAASGISMQPGNQFLIASISKVFTATAIFSYVDEGLLSIDDPVNKWIDRSITDQISNANECRIKDLLSHTSGIPDYYTFGFEMDRFSRENNGWYQEDVLEFVYGKKAYFDVGEYYSYSNTNFLLLGMILEKVSGKTLKEVYEEKIFHPLELQSAYYGVGEASAPEGVVKGYMDLYGNGDYVESDFLYMDEIGIGGDGGIAINAQDLGMFMDKLMDGNILSESSLNTMQNWFEKPYYWDQERMYTNGYGLEYFDNEYGIAYGHTGGVDGFLSLLNYYPDQDVLFVLLVNFTVGSMKEYEKMESHIADFEEAIFE